MWRGMPPYTVTAVIAAAILWLTLAPKPLGDSELRLFPHQDKAVHAVMFLSLTLAVIVDRCRRGLKSRRVHLAVAAGASVALGGLTEVLQQCMHLGRSGDWLDFAADIAGAAVAAVLVRAFASRLNYNYNNLILRK